MRFRCIDEETRAPNEREVRVAEETWGGKRLVRLAAGEFDLPQYSAQVFVDAATAEELGEWLLRAGLVGQLLEAGWLPAPEDAEGSQGEDEWTPPDDRRELFTFKEAVEVMRARRGAGGAQ